MLAKISRLCNRVVQRRIRSDEKTKSLSLNKRLRLNPPLKKEDIGGFALDRFGKIPPTPLCKGGGLLFTDKFQETKKDLISSSLFYFHFDFSVFSVPLW
jgi:hypothetical protein